jgi:hypothetical protein
MKKLFYYLLYINIIIFIATNKIIVKSLFYLYLYYFFYCHCYKKVLFYLCYFYHKIKQLLNTLLLSNYSNFRFL